MQADEEHVAAEQEHEAQLARLLQEDAWSAVRKTAIANQAQPSSGVSEEVLQDIEVFKAEVKDKAEERAATPSGDLPRAAATTPEQRQQQPKATEQPVQAQPATEEQQPATPPPAREQPAAQPAAAVSSAGHVSEEDLPEPKAPTGRRLPAASTQWQNNDTFEAAAEGECGSPLVSSRAMQCWNIASQQLIRCLVCRALRIQIEDALCVGHPTQQ